MRRQGIPFHGPVNSGEAGGHRSKPKVGLALVCKDIDINFHNMVPSLKIHRKNNGWLRSQCASFNFYQAISFQKIKKIQTVCGQGPSKTRAMLAKIDFVMIVMVLHN